MPLIISDISREIQPEDYIEHIPIVNPDEYKQARLVFFTTPEMEAAFEAQYQTELRNYVLPRNSKYTEYAFVKKPPRIFEVRDENTIICNGSICPSRPIEGGGIYVLDSSFRTQIAAFQTLHPMHRVIFYPSGQSPTLHYCAGKYVVPARLTSIYGGDDLNIEDMDKYDICVL
jgi:hypothetical protein